MKKYVGVLLSLICVVALTACGKNLDNIPSFSVIQEQGDEWATEKLTGYTKDNLQEIWGESDGMLSGMFGEVWQVEDDFDQIAEEVKAEFEVGKTVLVQYNGTIEESYPAQLSAEYGVRLLEE